MSDYTATERRMAELLPEMPQYRALTRVFSSKLILAALCTMLGTLLLGFLNLGLSLPSMVSAMLADTSGIDNPAVYESIVSGALYGMIGFVVLASLAVAAVQLVPQILLISRARRGKLLGRKPFTVLRIYYIVVAVLIVIDLFFALLLRGTLVFNTIQLLSLALTAVAYFFAIRMLGSQRDIAVWGKAGKKVPYSAAALIFALQMLTYLSTILLTVLQYVNPQYFKLTVYSFASLPMLLLSIAINLLNVLSAAFYSLTVYRAGKELSAAAAQEQIPQ